MADELEQHVLNALRSMLTKYQSMDELADQMLAADSAPDILDAATIQLKQQRESLERLENETRAAKEEYRASREHASPAVQSLTDELAKTMQGFLMKISALEKVAKSSCEALRPQIDNGVRAVQMKHAYGKHVG